MRVSNSMLYYQSIRNMQKNMEKLREKSAQTAAEKRLLRSSIDPYAASQSLKVRAEIDQLLQYHKNAEDSEGKLTYTEENLSKMNDLLLEAYELSVYAANEITVGDERLDAIQKKVDEILAEINSYANDKYLENYLYSGTSGEAPFQKFTRDISFADPLPAGIKALKTTNAFDDFPELETGDYVLQISFEDEEAQIRLKSTIDGVPRYIPIDANLDNNVLTEDNMLAKTVVVKNPDEKVLNTGRGLVVELNDNLPNSGTIEFGFHYQQGGNYVFTGNKSDIAEQIGLSNNIVTNVDGNRVFEKLNEIKRSHKAVYGLNGKPITMDTLILDTAGCNVQIGDTVSFSGRHHNGKMLMNPPILYSQVQPRLNLSGTSQTERTLTFDFDDAEFYRDAVRAEVAEELEALGVSGLFNPISDMELSDIFSLRMDVEKQPVSQLNQGETGFKTGPNASATATLTTALSAVASFWAGAEEIEQNDIFQWSGKNAEGEFFTGIYRFSAGATFGDLAQAIEDSFGDDSVSVYLDDEGKFSVIARQENYGSTAFYEGINPATAATEFTNLADAWENGSPAVGDSFSWSGEKADGNYIEGSYTLSANATLQDLFSAIEASFDGEVQATIEDGIVKVQSTDAKENFILSDLSFNDVSGGQVDLSGIHGSLDLSQSRSGSTGQFEISNISYEDIDGIATIRSALGSSTARALSGGKYSGQRVQNWQIVVGSADGTIGQTSGSLTATVVDSAGQTIKEIELGSRVHEPSTWAGDTIATISASGNYDAGMNDTWTFTVDNDGGTIGQVSASLTLTVTDSRGRTVTTLDVGSGYAGGPIVVADGVEINLSPGETLQADDSFTLELEGYSAGNDIALDDGVTVSFSAGDLSASATFDMHLEYTYASNEQGDFQLETPDRKGTDFAVSLANLETPPSQQGTAYFNAGEIVHLNNGDGQEVDVKFGDTVNEGYTNIEFLPNNAITVSEKNYATLSELAAEIQTQLNNSVLGTYIEATLVENEIVYQLKDAANYSVSSWDALGMNNRSKADITIDSTGNYSGITQDLVFVVNEDGTAGETEGLQLTVQDTSGAVIDTLTIDATYTPGTALQVNGTELYISIDNNDSLKKGERFVVHAEQNMNPQGWKPSEWYYPVVKPTVSGTPNASTPQEYTLKVVGDGGEIGGTGSIQIQVLDEEENILSTLELGSRITADQRWDGESDAEFTVTGTYTGTRSRHWTFQAQESGTVGQTDPLLVDYYDESGFKVGTVDLGSGYTGTNITLANGVDIAFETNGEIVADDQFDVNLYRYQAGDELALPDGLSVAFDEGQFYADDSLTIVTHPQKSLSAYGNNNKTLGFGEASSEAKNPIDFVITQTTTYEDLIQAAEEAFDFSIRGTVTNEGYLQFYDIVSGESKFQIEINPQNQGFVVEESWEKESSVDAMFSGNYDGAGDDTWIFKVDGNGGMVGQSSDLIVNVTDKLGNHIQTLNLGDDYQGQDIEIANGVYVRFSQGDLAAYDMMTLDLKGSGSLTFGNLGRVQKGEGYEVFSILERFKESLNNLQQNPSISEPTEWKYGTSTASPMIEGEYHGKAYQKWTVTVEEGGRLRDRAYLESSTVELNQAETPEAFRSLYISINDATEEKVVMTQKEYGDIQEFVDEMNAQIDANANLQGKLRAEVNYEAPNQYTLKTLVGGSLRVRGEELNTVRAPRNMVDFSTKSESQRTLNFYIENEGPYSITLDQRDYVNAENLVEDIQQKLQGNPNTRDITCELTQNNIEFSCDRRTLLISSASAATANALTEITYPLDLSNSDTIDGTGDDPVRFQIVLDDGTAEVIELGGTQFDDSAAVYQNSDELMIDLANAIQSNERLNGKVRVNSENNQLSFTGKNGANLVEIKSLSNGTALGLAADGSKIIPETNNILGFSYVPDNPWDAATENGAIGFDEAQQHGEAGNDEVTVSIKDQNGVLIKKVTVDSGNESIEVGDGIKMLLGEGYLTTGDSFDVELYRGCADYIDELEACRQQIVRVQDNVGVRRSRLEITKESLTAFKTNKVEDVNRLEGSRLEDVYQLTIQYNELLNSYNYILSSTQKLNMSTLFDFLS